MSSSKTGRLKLKTVNFQWIICDFSSIECSSKTGDFVYSPVFFNAWLLRLFPKGDDGKNADCFTLYLCNERDHDVTASYTISILDKDGGVVYSHVATDTKFERKWGDSGWGFDKPRQILEEAFDSDKLTVQCEICMNLDNALLPISATAAAAADQSVDAASLEDSEHAFGEFEQLLESGELSDVAFAMGDHAEIRAHKAILVARSPVFKAMFTNGMAEKEDKVVKIHDVEAKIFKELLRFVYSGRVEGIEAIAEDLLVAADKYLIDRLKERCERVLIKSINVGNALTYLRLGEDRRALTLKSEALKFFTANSDVIIEKPEFEEFRRSCSHMIVELMRNMIHEFKKKKPAD